ncbi:MAG: 50S ribosomal protein L4 [Planctomycetota bacterium]
MVAVPVYDAAGTKTREIEIDPTALDKAVRKPLLKEALVAYLASKRQGTHSTKTRGEVVGSTAKMWRQKGTGRARAGSKRVPHWVGGGRAHGPKPRDYSVRLPRKQRRLAVRSSIRYRLQRGELCAVEGLDGLAKPQTKAVRQFMQGIGLAGKGALFVSEDPDRNLYLSTRNLQKVEAVERRNLNAGQVLQRPNLIFTAKALDALAQEVSA